LGHAEWASDERFSTNRARLKHKALLLPMIAALMRITPRAERLARLSCIGGPCAPVNSIPEVLAEPQTQALGMVQPVPKEDFSLVAMPLSFNGERPRMAGPAPRPDAHNKEILGG
jgi:crotonobetainyl-CoA:carnitine CoA-transferase CaiB-like acyl-CoA transferase